MFKRYCPRCGNELGAHTMSWFTTDIICVQCQQDEKTFPNYKEARRAEEVAVSMRIRDFPGIGLTREDYVAMHAAIQGRRMAQARSN